MSSYRNPSSGGEGGGSGIDNPSPIFSNELIPDIIEDGPASELHDLAEKRELFRVDNEPLSEEQRREQGMIENDAQTYVVGDIHANLDILRAQLMLCGAIDSQNIWVGGNRTVVLDGDLIDRGNNSLACLDLVEKLQNEAVAAGGKLVYLIGNHELMWMLKESKLLLDVRNGSFNGMDIQKKLADTMAKFSIPPEAAQAVMINEMSERLMNMANQGRLLPAHTVAGWLVVHGQMSAAIRDRVLTDMLDEDTPPSLFGQPCGKILADQLNAEFAQAVTADKQVGAGSSIDKHFSKDLWLTENLDLFWDRLLLPNQTLPDEVYSAGNAVRVILTSPAEHTDQINAHSIQPRITDPIIGLNHTQIGIDFEAGSGRKGLGVVRIFPDAQKYAIIEAVEVDDSQAQTWAKRYGFDLLQEGVVLDKMEFANEVK